MKLQSAEPRIFGVVPPSVALVLGVGALIVGIVLLASGALVPGLIWLAAGVALLALAIDASRRWPASRLPRLAVGAVDGTGRRLGLARVSAGAWVQASRRVVSLRRELRRLRSDRDASLLALGEATYQDEPEEARRLLKRVGAIDERIEAAEREIEESLAGARRRVKKERVAARPTQEFAVAETPPPLSEDEKTRTAPTAARRRPPAPRSV
jgi:hypothetical protein